MSKNLVFVLGAFAALGAPSVPVVAQQPYWERGASNGSAARAEDDDLLRPYYPRRAGAGNYPREASAAYPAERVRTNYYAQRRNYFPGQRAGQSPNRNYISPDRLCVPGRRAFLY